jgi:autotransporter passenger strand-loop-strand repeat protein
VAGGTKFNGGYGVVFGTDRSATVSGGATEYVFGSALSVTVLTSGYEVVEAGGNASATTVSGGI